MDARIIDLRKDITSLSEIRPFNFKINKAFTNFFAPTFSDLSNNRIGCLTVDVFQGLTNLTKL